MTQRDELMAALSADNFAIAMAMFNRGVDPMADMPLPMQQLKALFYVRAMQPTRANDLKLRLGVGAATASGIVSRLVARGLIDKVPSTGDRRVKLLETTAEGEALMRDVTSVGRRNHREIVDELSLDELAALTRGFAAVRNAMARLGMLEER